MNKKFLLIICCGLLHFSQSAFAAQTTSQFFIVGCPETNSVATNGGNIAATINTDTGALSTSLNPGFTITTNNRGEKELTLSAKANTSTTTQNAIFNIGSARYIILTNNTVLPPIASLTDIKTGSPTAANNSNAIAYAINDPTNIPGQLSVAYNSGNKNWDLEVTHRGSTSTSVTIPSGTPLSGTYSSDDEAGSYKATITLSFNP